MNLGIVNLSNTQAAVSGCCLLGNLRSPIDYAWVQGGDF